VGGALFEKCVNTRDTTAIIWWEKTRSGMRTADRTADQETIAEALKQLVGNLPL